MGKRNSRVVLSLVLLALGGYFMFQVFALVRERFSTEQAVLYTVYEEVAVSGYVLRDETVIYPPESATPFILYEVDMGQRVPVGGVIASYYSSREQLETNSERLRLEATVTSLKRLQTSSTLGLGGAVDIERRMFDLIMTIAESAAYGSSVQAHEVREQLVYLVTRKQLATRELYDAEALIGRLEAQLALMGSISRPSGHVYASRAGYFLGVTDGYESSFASALAGKLTAEQLRNMIDSPPENTKGAAGKLVEGFTWFYACIIDPMQVSYFSVGRVYQLRFAHAPQKDMPAVLTGVYASGEDGYVLTFAGTRMTTEMMLLRTQDANIVRVTHQGLRISNEARRILDGKVGVYIRDGLTMRFRPIEVLYAADSYSIVKWQPNVEGALKLYDEVILSGRRVYSGRVVN